jgi:hypothetical protein
MSYRFDQLQRTVHRMNFPLVDLDAARSSTGGTIAFGALPSCHFAGPTRLNHATESLANFMRGDFDLIVVRRPRTLLGGLDLAGYISRLFENFGKFLFEF